MTAASAEDAKQLLAVEPVKAVAPNLAGEIDFEQLRLRSRHVQAQIIA